MTCYIIILNYNGWKDTVECLDSVFQTTNARYKVIVCDNASSNNSLEHIEEWLNGKITLSEIKEKFLLKRHLQNMPKYTLWKEPLNEKYDTPLLLVQNGSNRGFAAGNNVGIKIALNQNDCDCLFILNNDTVITKNTIYAGMAAMKKKPKAGICSTTVKYYDNPSKAAWHKTFFDPKTGNEIMVDSHHEYSNKYLYRYTGMSFFVTKQFIEMVGLMEEKYFLYFEELDWTIRGKNKFDFIMAKDSIVYHKEGSSASYQSPLSRFCLLRSRFLFIQKYYPKKLLRIYLMWCLRGVKRILEGNFSYGLQIMKFLVYFPFKGEKYTAGYFNINK